MTHTISGIQLLPGNNIWNTDISRLPPDPNSVTYIAAMGPTLPLHVKVSPLSIGWSIPYNLVNNSTPTYAVTYFYPGGPSPFPIPASPLIEEPTFPGSDRHMLCLNTDTGMLYEMTSVGVDGSGHVVFPVTATSGALWNMSSNILPPDFTVSADAAGLPVLPGLICYDEVASGVITHALRCAVPFENGHHIWPARSEAFIAGGTNYPPNGTRFRLKASVDISGYSTTNQVILQALKTYGCFLADGGTTGVMQFYGPPDDRWDFNDIQNVLNNQAIGTIFLSQCEIVNESALQINPNSGAAMGITPDASMLFTSGYIQLPAAVNTANWTALTFEFWINLTRLSGYPVPIGNDQASSSNTGIDVWIDIDGTLNLNYASGGTNYQFASMSKLALFTWYHVAITLNTSTVAIYLNGALDHSGASNLSRITQTALPLWIGGNPYTGVNLVGGYLDEVAVYPTALSAARILAHYHSTTAGNTANYATTILGDSPVAYYHLNETSGLVAHDATTNGYNATLAGSSLSYNQVGILISDTAIGFGAYDSIIFPSTLVLANYAGYSLEYWINVTQGWQHIVITVDSTGNTLYYLNGASYSSGSGDSVVVDIDVYYTGSFSAGSLDEIAAYPYVLSPAQVANHFTVGSLGV